MHIELGSGPIDKIQADALALFAFEGGAPVESSDPRVLELYASGEFTGKALDVAILHAPAEMEARRLVLVGAGNREKFTAAEARNVGGAVVRALKAKGMHSLAFALGANASDEVAAALVEGATLGDYEPDRYKTDPKKAEKYIDKFIVAGATQTALHVGSILGEAQNFARGLVNEPGNLLTPSKLATEAKAMAEEAGLNCEVLDEEAMRGLGMGSLLGVSMGSAQPPAFIVLRYNPAHTETTDHLGLVGKGVTFDTGGISIKPSEGMEKMKYDMAGGAAVIGAMKAIAALKPALRVTGFVPAVENMPSDRAVRPGDILTSMAGKTIEVLNTDAEGRLILVDAITYAKKEGCTHLVDAATLTGSIGIALGTLRAGAFTNNEKFLGKLIASSQAEGEKLWQMPMDDEYKEGLKSAFADLPNISGGRAGGSITAAWFLREFADPTPWVHLDIANVAWLDEPKPYAAKGPTGFAFRTFVHLATHW